MPSRCYFIDAITNEEIACEWQGWFPAAEDSTGCSPRTGVQYTDTMWSITVSRGPYSRETRKVTAEDFPGRVVKVKTWWSGVGRPGSEFRVLITEAMGFATLNAVPARGPVSRHVGTDGKRYREHVRSEILGNRAALKHMLANAPKARAAA